MSRARVAVTGFGLISALGRGADENAAALRAGKSGLIGRPEWADDKIRSRVAGNVDIEPLRTHFDRKESRFLCDAALLAAVAMKDAIEHAGLSQAEVEDPRTGVVMGTGGASVPDAVALGDRMRKARGREGRRLFCPTHHGVLSHCKPGKYVSDSRPFLLDDICLFNLRAYHHARARFDSFWPPRSRFLRVELRISTYFACRHSMA